MSKLLISIFYSDKKLYEACKKELIKIFGDILKESKAYSFDKFTDYYEKEMGKGLVKRFVIFKKPIEKISLNNKPIEKNSLKIKLIKIKLKTTELEKKFSKQGKRMVNLDPGYLTGKELVLASFKPGTNYKEKISNKVYAHKVLEFKGKEAITFWHTFPDYKEKKKFFVGFK